MAYVTDPETGRLVNDGALVAPGTRTNILASIASIEERLTVLEDAAADAEYAITTFAELQAAAALTTQVRVHLYDHITCTAAITLPANLTIIYRGKYLVDGGYSIIHYANVGDMTREKKFSGFVAGDIVGSFGNGTVYPEWWGLTDNAHDIAIQCAASASPVSENTRGIIVDLDARQYDVAAPINLAGKYAILRGKGSALTELQATTAWTAATWYETDIWTAGVSTANHSAMVWIGSAHTLGTVNSFRCGVQGLTLNTLYASQYNWTKRVSGISSQSYVEENSVIHDVEITYASGCGIGFPDHGPTYGTSGGVINGLSISSVWIAGPCKRDSYGMYFTHWNANTSIDTFTIDMSLDQELSSAYAGAAPTQIHDWPMVGIMAGGNLNIKNGHIEGVGIGILVGENDGAGNGVTIQNVEGYYLMNRGWGQIYRDQQTVTTLSAVATHNAGADINVTVGSSTGMAAGDVLLITSANGTNEATYEAYHTVVSIPDGTHVVIDTAWPGAGAVATTAGNIQIIYKAMVDTAVNHWDWGTVVLIAKDEESGGRANVKDKVVLHNVNSKGVCKYVFRDSVYAQHISAYGSGGAPTGGTRGVASYYRGSAYVNPATWPFDALSTTWTNQTDRTYFTAPVY